MRRDVCYFFSADVINVYNAYLTAATNQKFRRECKSEPFHTISFGLNFSMKYNMNGGACTLHFIPYREGTAVDLRFSIAQLVGARYEKYADDLTNAAAEVLGIVGMKFELDIEAFTNEMNKVRADGGVNVAMPEEKPVEVPVSMTPVMPEQETPFKPASGLKTTMPNTNAINPRVEGYNAQTAPVAVSVGKKLCRLCGYEIESDSAFCCYCGAKAVEEKRFCANCGRQAEEGAAFCSGCGTKLI